jgi:hypothetical protein
VLPYVVEVMKHPDGITAWAGLPLVLEAMRALGMAEEIRREVKVRQRESGYSEARKVEALVMLLAAGGECLDDIKVLQGDAGLVRLVGKLPGEDALRTFLYEFHDEELMLRAQVARKKNQVAYIPEENEGLQGLGRVNAKLVARVAAQGNGRKATLDHDATIQESHKREALWHYKGGRGYQPSVIYWAEQDLVVADEYRDGTFRQGWTTYLDPAGVCESSRDGARVLLSGRQCLLRGSGTEVAGGSRSGGRAEGTDRVHD